MPRKWIHSKVTLDKVGGSSRAKDLISPSDCPEWRAFKKLLQEKDELWYFTSPFDSFLHCAGRMGYVILRNRKQVDNYVAFMN